MALKLTPSQRTLQTWAEQWEKEHLPAPSGEKVSHIRRLINQAHFDLLFGPNVGDDDADSDWYQYPGFGSACTEIKEALSEVPSTLYLDTDCECWQENEPSESDECDNCGGEGTVEDELVEEAECPECQGRGYFESSGYWLQVERSELVKAIVGKDLAEYVR